MTLHPDNPFGPALLDAELHAFFTGQLDPAVAECIDHCLRPVVYLEFAENRRNVILYRLIADAQDRCNLLVAVATRNAIEDFDLARGKR